MMQFSQEMQRCEMSVHKTVRNKGQSPFKWHKNCEIALLLDKPSCFWIGGNVICAKKGDIVFFNTHTVHSFIHEENETSIGLIIFDLKAVLNPGTKFVPLKSYIPAEEIDAIAGLRAKIETLFNFALEERSSLRVIDNPVLQSLISSLYLLLMRHFPADKKQPEKKQLNDFYRIIDYINDHFKEGFNIKTMAQALYMSREKVSSVFLKYSNSKLCDYIDTLRINYANNLILAGRNITEAALESGFQSIRTFNSTYKRIMGITPSEYLRNNSAKI